MRYVLTVLFVLCAATASAQTHPCDIVPVQNPNLTSPIKTTFCHSGKESDNITPIMTWRVYLDAIPAPVVSGPLTPIGVASSTGLFYFETGTFPVSKGTHVVVVVGLDSAGLEVTARSASVPFGVSNPLGAAPVNVGVKK